MTKKEILNTDNIATKVGLELENKKEEILNISVEGKECEETSEEAAAEQNSKL